MSNFYYLFEWLSLADAIDFLDDLTSKKNSKEKLMALCRGGHCDTYLDSPPPDGKSVLPETGAFCRTSPGPGHHLIKWPHPHVWKTGEIIQFCVQGNVTQFDFFEGETLLDDSERFGSRQITDGIWFVDLKEKDFEPRFKRADISLLVARGRSAEVNAQLADSVGTQNAPSQLMSEQVCPDRDSILSIRAGGNGERRLVAEQVYRQLDWLTLEQALDWMNIISGQKLDSETLYAMAEFGYCSMHMDCRGVRGAPGHDEGRLLGKDVFGMGYCQINNPLRAEGENVRLTGPVMFFDDYGNAEIYLSCFWCIDPKNEGGPLFKPSEIEIAGGMIEEGGGWTNSRQINAEGSVSPVQIKFDKGGAELARLLRGLRFHINEKTDGSFGYSVMFDGGQFLAELDESFTPEIGADAQVPKVRLECESAARKEAEKRAKSAESEAAELRQRWSSDKQAIAPTKPAYLDEQHPNYAHKLVAAIRAWEEVSGNPSRSSGKSVKTAMIEWLNDHAKTLGLLKKDGSTNSLGANEIAKVANWKQEGGSPKTPTK